MSALPPIPDVSEPLRPSRELADQFIVSYGKSGILGVFTAGEPLSLARGSSVIVQTSRGIEIGAVLGPASIRQARLLGATSAGELLRRACAEDQERRRDLAMREQQIYNAGRALAATADLPLEILDVDLLFDGRLALVQFLGAEAGAESLAQELEKQFDLTVHFENLVVPAEPEDHAHGCGKPDCGKTDGGGCSTCSTGGGCSSCGSSKVDLRPYFSHLRDQMQVSQRIPLA